MLKCLWLALVATLLCVSAHAQTATQIPPGKVCFSGSVGQSGVIGQLGTWTAGSLGTDGTYSAPLLGGSGSGAIATVTVSGGLVTGQTLTNPGQGYAVGDTLTASPAAIGGTLGYSTTVSTTALSGALAGGSVAFYIPGGTTPKSTWQDAAETILNQNPVPLDGNGCALIYGAGSYRQILKDSLGNLVWDQVVSATTSASNIPLASGQIIVGNANGVGAAVTVSGSCSLSNTGAITCTGSKNYIDATGPPYNVVNTDVQGNCAANTAAYAQAFIDAKTAGLPLYLGTGNIHTNALVWDGTNAASTGFRAYGAGQYLTTLDERVDANDTTCVPDPNKAGLHIFADNGDGFNFGKLEDFSVLTDFDGAACELGQSSNVDPINIGNITNVACRNNNSISNNHLGTGCLFHFFLNSILNGVQCTAYADQTHYAQAYSSSSVTAAASGQVTFAISGTVPTNWVSGQFVTAFDSAHPTTIWMVGTVASYSGGTLVMNVVQADPDGVGQTSTNWTVHGDGVMYGTALTCTQCQFLVFNGGSMGNAAVDINIPTGAFTQALTFNGTDIENSNYSIFNTSNNAHAITFIGARFSLWTQFMAYSSTSYYNQSIKIINPTLGSTGTQFNTSSTSNGQASGIELDNGEPLWTNAPTFPASGVPWYNYTMKPLTVNVWTSGTGQLQGTVIGTNINGGVRTIGYPAGASSYVLGPGDFIATTYTNVTPSWAMRAIQ